LDITIVAQQRKWKNENWMVLSALTISRVTVDGYSSWINCQISWFYQNNGTSGFLYEHADELGRVGMAKEIVSKKSVLWPSMMEKQQFETDEENYKTKKNQLKQEQAIKDHEMIEEAQRRMDIINNRKIDM
jgi:hypothetical protein